MEEISSGIRVAKSLKRILDRVKKQMVQQFKDVSLTGPQVMIIGVLSHSGQMKISDLSEKMGLSNSTVSGIIDRLEKQGFVERLRSEEDRRVVYVSLTPRARCSSIERFGGIEKSFEDILRDASQEEIEIITKGFEVLEKIMDRLEK